MAFGHFHGVACLGDAVSIPFPRYRIEVLDSASEAQHGVQDINVLIAPFERGGAVLDFPRVNADDDGQEVDQQRLAFLADVSQDGRVRGVVIKSGDPDLGAQRIGQALCVEFRAQKIGVLGQVCPGFARYVDLEVGGFGFFSGRSLIYPWSAKCRFRPIRWTGRFRD